MVEVFHDNYELVNHLVVKAVYGIAQENPYPMNTITTEAWKLMTQGELKNG